MKKKVLIVFGTRPEAIKMAPLVKKFKMAHDSFDTKVCVTAQHREMLDQVLNFFEIIPDYDLNLMKPNQNLHTITGDIVRDIKPVLDDFKPDYVFVHGDTTTSFVSGLAAFYSGAKVCHVEAGLRTFNKYAPFPEEMNRTLTARLTDYHFAPTQKAKENLLKENVKEADIIVTGNTVIDALLDGLQKVNDNNLEEIEELKNNIGYDALVKAKKKILLVTGHRRENHGQGFINICEALKTIAESHSDVQIIYPVHLNPNVKKPVFEYLSNIDNISLIDPLPYPEFIWLMDKSHIIITDSGGIQEEAPSLGKPVLVMRDTTERPEAVEAGTVILVGTDKDKIVNNTNHLLTDSLKYEEMSQLHNPYGDGKATTRIVEHLKN